MRWWRSRKSRETDLARELRAHLELETEDQRDAGLPPREASYAAQRNFGNQTLIQEETRAVWKWTSIENFRQDLQHAGRMFRKSPWFVLLAILTLALGIGTNTAIFSVVDVVLLRPLPYPNSARLVRVQTKNDPLHIQSGPASYPDFADWRAYGVFEDTGIYFIGSSILQVGDTSERLPSGAASTSLFSTLGVQPLIGRLPPPAEDKPGTNQSVLLTESLWRRVYGADPSIVGRTIKVNGKGGVVVAVLPSSFVFERNPELWTTFEMNEDLALRQDRYLAVLARLRPHQTLQQANSRLTALCSNLAAQFGDTNKGWSAYAVPMQKSEVADVRAELLVLLGAVFLVMFICCGNVAMLLLVRGSRRRREFGIRAALGASRPRIAAQLLTENLLLSVLGGALGVALATWCVPLLVRYGPRDIPRLDQVHVDVRILLFALALSILTTLVFGLGPALQLSRSEVNSAFEEGGKSATGDPRRALLRTCFLMAEMAFSLVLLVGGALLLKSFTKLTSIDPGFRVDHLLTFHLPLPDVKFLDGGKYLEGQVRRYYQRVTDELERLPQVESAAGTLDLPLGGGGYRLWQGFAVPHNPDTAISKTLCVSQSVTSHFFHTMGVPLKAGRFFSDSDTSSSLPVAVVNEAFARKYFHAKEPVGQQVQLEGSPTLRQVVGVVGDVKPDGLDSVADAEVYTPFSQVPKPFLVIVLRTKVPPMSVASAVRNVLMHVDRDVPPYRVRSAEEVLALSLAERRFSTALITAFALIALLLAAVGLYGVVSYSVSQSTREIGIRMALGAKSRDVFIVALRQGLTPSLLGLGVGVTISLGLMRLMTRLLYEVHPLDWGMFALASAVLVMVSILACLVPARRAAQVDPLTALRHE